ncbi:Ig-like domain-containing protein [Simiduia aestuariiviva]|uniref:Cadherin-like domain-containing protein n=1 Tax=Simiduia aestuariiviva TaxID=1510459 RepID=A0A839URD2_9GAMM|nr:Ig-like domain-containing protein [Simiduia aestuariiviva]MBB3169029.1 hypothetical protein [Simiduia aestuariiviva]
MQIKPIIIFVIAAGLLVGCGSEKTKNRAPVATSSSFTTEVDSTLTGQLSASDQNRDMLMYRLTTEPTQGIVILESTGAFSYTPKAEYTGLDSFSFSVSDGKVESTKAIVSIEINPQQVLFSSYSRSAFSQSADAKPLSTNGREFEQDVVSEQAYDDLLSN